MKKNSRIKSLALFLALTLVMLIVAACGADIDSTLTIDENFKGERRFKAVFSTETLNYVDGGMDTVKAVINEKMPDVLQVEYTTGEEDAEIATFVMTFDSQDDYANQLSELLAAGRQETTLAVNFNTASDDPFSGGFEYEENVSNTMLFDWLIQGLEETGKVDASGDEMVSSESFVVKMGEVEYDLSRSGDTYSYQSYSSTLRITEAKWIIRYTEDNAVTASLYMSVEYEKGNAKLFTDWAAMIEEETGATYKAIAEDVQHPYSGEDYRLTQGLFTLSAVPEEISEFGKKMTRDPNYSLSIEQSSEDKNLFSNALEIKQTLNSEFLNYPEVLFVIPAGSEVNQELSESYADPIPFGDFNFSFGIEPDTDFKALLGYAADEMIFTSYSDALQVVINSYIPLYNVSMESSYSATGELDREIMIETEEADADTLLTKVKEMAIDVDIKKASDKEAFPKTGKGIEIEIKGKDMKKIAELTGYFVPVESKTYYIDRSLLKYNWTVKDVIDGEFLNRVESLSYSVELPAMGKFEKVGQKQWRVTEEDRYVKYRVTGNEHYEAGTFDFFISGTKLLPLILIIAGSVLLLVLIILIIVLVVRKNKKRKQNMPQQPYAQYPQYPQPYPQQGYPGQMPPYDPNAAYTDPQFDPNQPYAGADNAEKLPYHDQMNYQYAQQQAAQAEIERAQYQAREGAKELEDKSVDTAATEAETETETAAPQPETAKEETPQAEREADDTLPATAQEAPEAENAEDAADMTDTPAEDEA